MKISKLTGKLKGFEAINTNTLSNAFCSKMRATDAICQDCYSASMLQGVRKNCVEPWQRNSDELSKAIPIENLPTINAHSFRFHAHGELINYVHLENFMNIAKANPFTTFGLWTKRLGYVRKYLKNNSRLDNVILIYSNTSKERKMKRPPKGFDKVFNSLYDDTVTSKNEKLCTGKSCMECMACYRHNNFDVIVEKVK